MAQSSGMGDILKYGLLAVGGYFLYNWWTSQSSTTATTTTTGGGTTSTGTTGTTTTTPQTTSTGTTTTTTPTTTTTTGSAGGAGSPTSVSQKLLALSGGVNSLNADGWSYYFTTVNGGVALTPSQFAQAFPAITATDRGGTMTAAAFVAALAAAGVAAPAGYGMNGLGQWKPRVPIPVPALMRRRR